MPPFHHLQIILSTVYRSLGHALHMLGFCTGTLQGVVTAACYAGKDEYVVDEAVLRGDRSDADLTAFADELIYKVRMRYTTVACLCGNNMRYGCFNFNAFDPALSPGLELCVAPTATFRRRCWRRSCRS